MRNDRAWGSRATSSPGQAFLSGIGAGLGAVLLGTVVAWFLGGPESVREAQVQWVSPLVGAAVAAGVVAAMRGSSAGRMVALAIMAFFGAFFLSGPLDYFVLASSLSGPGPGGTYEGFYEALLWRRHLVASAGAVTVGALLGLMFGRRGVLQ